MILAARITVLIASTLAFLLAALIIAARAETVTEQCTLGSNPDCLCSEKDGCFLCKSEQECKTARAAYAAANVKPVPFKGWQRAWQCNDIRVTETVTQRGIVNYDLGGTIWGGSQFALDIQRGTMWFNGRPCAFLGGTQ
jgi:hypothetical protein